MPTPLLDELALRVQRPVGSLAEFEVLSAARIEALAAASNAALLREQRELRTALYAALGWALCWLLQKWLPRS